MFNKALLTCTLGAFLATALVIKGPRYHQCGNADGVEKGTINDQHIPEASGLAYSRLTDGVLWVHNDMGGTNWINAISEQGKRLADVKLDGASNFDWEDIAVNVEDGVSYIYLADTGDNNHVRGHLTIYKFKEPEVSHSWDGHDITISSNDIDHIRVDYSDYNYDCEALVVDPANRDILLFTKDHHNPVSKVFRVPHGAGDIKTLEYIATLPFYWVTGGDISPSGDTLALINLQEGWSWTKTPGQSWVDHLRTHPEPCKLNLRSAPQREAITVTDSGYWTTSETTSHCPAEGCPIWYYAKQ